METKAKKTSRGYWRFLLIWSVLLSAVLAAALIWFYEFLGDYQSVYEQTRPVLYQNEVMQLFEACDAELILEQAEPVELGPFENRENLVDFLNDYLAGKEINFGTKKGEHIEERPVYVVTADEIPFAVVRLKKKMQTADYGLPLWETDRIELLLTQAKEYCLLAPSTVAVTVNGIPVTEAVLEESGIRGTAEEYLEQYIQIPAYNRYNLGAFYCEPEVSGINAAGEAVDIIYDEKAQCYKAGFGGDKELQDRVEDYVIQVMTDYAMYVSNDAEEGSLDRYFPPKSILLKGIKTNARHYVNYHLPPEVKNQKMTEFTVYSSDAFSAQVYLEQHTYIPYNRKSVVLTTDLHVYFVKMDGTWKVSGIAYEYEPSDVEE